MNEDNQQDHNLSLGLFHGKNRGLSVKDQSSPYVRHGHVIGAKVLNKPLTGRNQKAKSNCVTVRRGGEEAGGEPQTG